ncbi:helix-turn-helix domain-containing protein [Kineosporia sp. J2-2]|uniref:Helix-turn-helix domain-containing protein n=1 Tax=Kineosporia corallincola TaxID=2835133 RepID=A0ABS5TJH3_9ACTN|nr:helix-turn-helix transcriptional regulator [Kineosporia corallincola]MBT0770218.1 helix-turn-helix domain-containing protein [Kineosporia corallincola]
MQENRLGEFLRARRELADPSSYDLPDFGRRRTPGLRRDELALLAGVSSYYYARLEQGRDRNPSEAVLDSIARVLQLDTESSRHLRELARPGPARRPRAKPERVTPALQMLLGTWPGQAAIITGRFRDVLAATELAVLVNPGFAVGKNLLRQIFLDPAARDIYPEWDSIAAGAVAGLRVSSGIDVDDPRLRALVGELSLKSEQFRRLWARHDVHEKTSGVKLFNNAVVGTLELNYATFGVNGSEGQTLQIFFPTAGSPAEQSMTLLSTLMPAPGGCQKTSPERSPR